MVVKVYFPFKTFQNTDFELTFVMFVQTFTLNTTIQLYRVSFVAGWNKWLVRVRHEKVRSEFVRNRVYNWSYTEIVTQCQYRE